MTFSTFSSKSLKSTTGVSKMDPQRPIYPQRVRKKSVGLIYAMAVKNVESRPREYQKWMCSIRFTPIGSEKRALCNFMTVRVTRFVDLASKRRVWHREGEIWCRKLSLASKRPDLASEKPNLARYGDLARFGSGPMAQGPWPMAQGPRPMGHGPWPSAQGSWPMAQGPWPKAPGPWPRT